MPGGSAAEARPEEQGGGPQRVGSTAQAQIPDFFRHTLPERRRVRCARPRPRWHRCRRRGKRPGGGDYYVWPSGSSAPLGITHGGGRPDERVAALRASRTSSVRQPTSRSSSTPLSSSSSSRTAPRRRYRSADDAAQRRTGDRAVSWQRPVRGSRTGGRVTILARTGPNDEHRVDRNATKSASSRLRFKAFCESTRRGTTPRQGGEAENFACRVWRG